MKKMILTLVLGLSSVAIMAQSSSSEITSLKPSDESPAVFSSQADLDQKKSEKIANIKMMIRENEGNEEKINQLREELWRFENAIVLEPKNKK